MKTELCRLKASSGLSTLVVTSDVSFQNQGTWYSKQMEGCCCLHSSGRCANQVYRVLARKRATFLKGHKVQGRCEHVARVGTPFPVPFKIALTKSPVMFNPQLLHPFYRVSSSVSRDTPFLLQLDCTRKIRLELR